MHIPIGTFQSKLYASQPLNDVKKDIEMAIYAFHTRLGYNFMYKNGKGETKLLVNERTKDDFSKIRKADFQIKWFKKDIFEFIKEVQNVLNEKNCHYDSLIINWSGHGERDGALITTDKNDNNIVIDEIMKRFNDINCPKLKYKPRLFLCDVCRGSTEPRRMKESEVDAFKEAKKQTVEQTLQQLTRINMSNITQPSNTNSNKKESKTQNKSSNDSKTNDTTISDEKSQSNDTYDSKLQNENPRVYHPYFISVFSTLEGISSISNNALFSSIRKTVQKFTPNRWHNNINGGDSNDDSKSDGDGISSGNSNDNDNGDDANADDDDNKDNEIQLPLKRMDLITLIMNCRQHITNAVSHKYKKRQYIDYSDFGLKIYIEENQRYLPDPAEMKQQSSVKSYSSFE